MVIDFYINAILYISDKVEVDRRNLYSFCTRKMRQKLYKIAKEMEYNVLAIGQHLDDICESFLLSIFHAGKLHSMKAHYRIR